MKEERERERVLKIVRIINEGQFVSDMFLHFRDKIDPWPLCLNDLHCKLSKYHCKLPSKKITCRLLLKICQKNLTSVTN